MIYKPVVIHSGLTITVIAIMYMHNYSLNVIPHTILVPRPLLLTIKVFFKRLFSKLYAHNNYYGQI